MNIITAAFSEPARRCSTESILSIQDKETDFVRDTSDTETFVSDGRDAEYEPVTESEGDEEPMFAGDSSGQSDNDIIRTKVIAVSVGDDGDLEFADSEQTDSEGSDSEMDLHDYWQCAQCHARNNNPLYRYCEKCFKVRKNFFPPRPKRKNKRTPSHETVSIPRTLSQDSGVESQTDRALSQDPNQPDRALSQDLSQTDRALSQTDKALASSSQNRPLKRRAESADRKNKRVKAENSDVDTDSESKLKEKAGDDMCIVCFSEPKSGVFVHGKIAHICCCYKCAVKVWAKSKRCPICNCKVSNVLKAVVM